MTALCYCDKHKPEYRAGCEDCRVKKRAYNIEYSQRPEVKARRRKYYIEYSQRPEVKARRRKYYQRPEVKARMREYYQRPEVKARKREYYQRPEVKAKRKEYQREYEQKGKDLKKLADEYDYIFTSKKAKEAFIMDGELLDKELNKKKVKK